MSGAALDMSNCSAPVPAGRRRAERRTATRASSASRPFRTGGSGLREARRRLARDRDRRRSHRNPPREPMQVRRGRISRCSRFPSWTRASRRSTTCPACRLTGGGRSRSSLRSASDSRASARMPGRGTMRAPPVGRSPTPSAPTPARRNREPLGQAPLPAVGVIRAGEPMGREAFFA